MTPARFGKLTKAGRRVATARDVIATIDAKRSVSTGMYVQVTAGDLDLGPIDETTELRTLLPVIESECRVCAMGALFLSHVRFADNFQLGLTLSGRLTGQDHNEGGNGYINDSSIIDNLHKTFSARQLRLIEAAFEGEDVNYNGLTALEDRAAELWQEEYQFDYDRLIAICRNIIRNEGTFYIKQLTAKRFVTKKDLPW